MLTHLSRFSSRDCDGYSRRDFLRIGSLGMGGMSLPGLLAVRASGHGVDLKGEVPFGPALALATWMVWLYGPLVPA